MTDISSILAVDDEADSLLVLSSILGAEGYQVRTADSGSLALKSVAAWLPELILLDVRMPGMDGFEVCQRLKTADQSSHVPIIFITAAGEVDERVKGLAAGAVDYISKPFHREELLARVRTHLELARLRRDLEKQVSERTADLSATVDRLRESSERIRHLGGRLLNAQDVERAHLARELHDDIGQQIVLLQIELQALMNRCDDVSLRDAVSDVATRATAIGTGVHNLSHRLHPSRLRLVGLTDALGTLVRQLSTHEVSVVFSHETVPVSLSEELTVCLYRIAQEALNNAIRHGRADKISVTLRGTRGSVHMSINDNGVGFDSQTAPAGVGLISMTERVEHVGGSLQIRSQPGGGTHVDVRIPCGEEGTQQRSVTDVSAASA